MPRFLVLVCGLSLSHVWFSWPHGLRPTSLLCPWNFPGKNTGVGCHFFLQKILPDQGSNLHLLCPSHWQGGSLVSQLVKNCPCEQCWSPQCDSWAGKICWRRDRPPTPVFLPGEFHGLSSPWGRKELDTTERLSQHHLRLFSLIDSGHLGIFTVKKYLMQ